MDFRGDEIRERWIAVVVPWPPVPGKVDWKKEAVIVVSAGQFQTAPCSVKIKSITQNGRKASIEVEVHGPGSIQSITTPWVIVKVERRNIGSVTATFQDI